MIYSRLVRDKDKNDFVWDIGALERTNRVWAQTMDFLILPRCYPHVSPPIVLTTISRGDGG